MSRIGGAIRDTISIENDAPRVSVRMRGRPSFQLLLNARDPTPGHSYLRFRRKCRPPSAPRVRLRTLNRTSYESKNAMTNVPTAARAASALRNFSIWGPPIESSAARARDVSQEYFTAVARTTPGKRDFDKHLFDSYTHFLVRRSLAALSAFARRVCVFKMSRIGGAIRDTMSIGNDAPRVSVRKRGRPVSGVVKCPGL